MSNAKAQRPNECQIYENDKCQNPNAKGMTNDKAQLNAKGKNKRMTNDKIQMPKPQ